MTPDHGDKTFVFVGGLQRSGTTAFHQLLGTSEQVSIFRDTGVPADEGQFLQTVIPKETEFGRAGRHAFQKGIRLTEGSPLVAEARQKLFSQWSQYWDLSRPVLAEKTPANSFRARFLQAVFPDSRFVFLIRHPISAVLAMEKWFPDLEIDVTIENWLRTYEIIEETLPHLNRAVVIHYENALDHPERVADVLRRRLDLSLDLDPSNFVNPDRSRYYIQWHKGDFQVSQKANASGERKFTRDRATLGDFERRYESRIRHFGYSFADPRPLIGSLDR